MIRKTIDDVSQLLPPVDFGELLARLNDNVEIATYLLKELQKSLPNYFVQIPDSFGKADLEQISASAHKLKGAALTLAANPLAVAAKELDLAAKAGDFEQTKMRYPDLMNEIQRYLEWAGNMSVNIELATTSKFEPTKKNSN